MSIAEGVRVLHTYRLAKDLLVGHVLNGFLDFSVGRIRSYNSILSRNLLLSSAAEIALQLLGSVDCGFQSSVNLSDLGSVSWIARFAI